MFGAFSLDSPRPTLETTFVAMLSEHAALHQNWALAVSGGSDSLGLLYMVHQWMESSVAPIPRVTVLSVDHGLRPCAAQEIAFVKYHAKMLGLHCEHFTIPPRTISPNIQQNSRRKRYQLLLKWCAQHASSCLLTAHTSSDNAETVLMRLERGVGLDGICGIPSTRISQNTQIIRPLLHLSRSTIQKYLIARNIPWIVDPSNGETRYRRVIYRKALEGLPNSEQFFQRVHRFSQNMRCAQNTLDYYLHQELKCCLRLHSASRAAIRRSRFNRIPRTMQWRILRYVIEEIGKQRYNGRGVRLHRILEDLSKEPSPRTKHCLHGCHIVIQDQYLHVTRASEPYEAQ